MVAMPWASSLGPYMPDMPMQPRLIDEICFGPVSAEARLGDGCSVHSEAFINGRDRGTATNQILRPMGRADSRARGHNPPHTHIRRGALQSRSRAGARSGRMARRRDLLDMAEP